MITARAMALLGRDKLFKSAPSFLYSSFFLNDYDGKKLWNKHILNGYYG
jgi:hypothetical protein